VGDYRKQDLVLTDDVTVYDLDPEPVSYVPRSFLTVRMVEDNSAVGAVVLRQLVAHVAAMTFKTRAIYNSRRDLLKECRVAVS
jgi:hypothetical protein